MSLDFYRRITGGMSVALLIALLAGCTKEEMPKTYVVQGKVVLPNGKPFPGGAITFRPVADQELQAYGEILDDGTFTLHTLGHTSGGRAQNLKGTIEGEFKVQIEPAPGKGRPFWLTKTYRIDPTEKNEITIVVEK